MKLFLLLLFLIESSKLRRGDGDDGDDDAIEAERRAEDLHDKHLNEEGVSLCVAKRSARARDADSDAAEEVAEAASEARAEDGVAGSVVSVVVALGGVLDRAGLHLKDDRDDDTVDGHGLAEEDADKVL